LAFTLSTVLLAISLALAGTAHAYTIEASQPVDTFSISSLGNVPFISESGTISASENVGNIRINTTADFATNGAIQIILKTHGRWYVGHYIPGSWNFPSYPSGAGGTIVQDFDMTDCGDILGPYPASSYPTGCPVFSGDAYILTVEATNPPPYIFYQGASLTGPAFYIVSDTVPPPPNTTSRIDSLDPADGTTTASTAITVNIGYYANSADGWDRVGYTIYNIDRNYAQEAAGEASTTLDTLSTYTSSRTLRSNGAYSMIAYLKNSVTGAIMESGADATGASNRGDSRFAVVSNPLPGEIGTTSLELIYGVATSTCSISNITGCFQNAIAWALYPSRSTLDLVTSSGNKVKNKPPFGYFFVNVATIQALNASGTPPVTLASDAPIVTYIFHPLDVSLAALIGFFYIMWLFQRVRHIEV
jgi:hypothetical protein